MKTPDELAELAYNGYAEQYKEVCLLTKDELPPYDSLPEPIKKMWRGCATSLSVVIKGEFKELGCGEVNRLGGK